MNASVTEVDLRGNSTGPLGAVYMADMLLDNIFITHLVSKATL